MAGRTDIEAGRAFVRLALKDDMTKRLTGAMNAAAGSLRKFASTTRGIGIGLAAVGGGAVAAFIPAIKAASDYQETMGKFNTVFGDQAATVKQWGDDFAEQVGRSKEQIASFMAGSQDLFIPLGFEPGAAENMSEQVTKLAVDLASFNNMQDPDALRDLHAALTGSGEVMKKYGVIVSEAAVKQKMLQDGIDPKTATDQQKVMARFAIIMAGTTAAQGDAIRTGDSFANQFKRMKATMSDTAVVIGDALLPQLTRLLKGASLVAKIFSGFAKENSKLISILAITVTAVAAVGFALIGVSFAASALATVFGVMSSVLGFLFTPLGVIGAALIAGVVLWAKYAGSGKSAIASLSGVLGNLLAIGKQTFGGIADAIATGDLALAGKIAFAGLQVAAGEGLMALRALVGDTVANIVGKLATGDFSGAWTDTLKQLSLLWSAWSESVVNVFTGVAKSVIKIWQDVVTSISKQILRLAKMPAFRAAFKQYSGVDMGTEQERGEKLRARDRERVSSQIAQYAGEKKQLQEEIEVRKLSKQLAVTEEPAKRQEIESQIAAAAIPEELKTQIMLQTETGGGDEAVLELQSQLDLVTSELEAYVEQGIELAVPYDIVALASDVAADNIEQQAQEIIAVLDDINRMVADRTAAAAGDAVAATESGIDALSVAIEEARKRLDSLTAEAAATREEAKKKAEEKAGGEVAGGKGIAALPDAKAAVFSPTFSAVVAQASGFQAGGNTAEAKLLNEVREQRKLAREQRDLAKKMLDSDAKMIAGIERLGFGLTYGGS